LLSASDRTVQEQDSIQLVVGFSRRVDSAAGGR
jgi:hypothetical protein